MQNKILLVDDREENIFSLEQMLLAPDRIFYHATSGNDALKIAFKEDISLILLDVQMPDMDGFETADLLKLNDKTRRIPVIFVTAINKDSKYVVKGLQGGAVDYLFKPLDVEITRSKVATLLQFMQQQTELDNKNKELKSINEEKNKFIGMAAHDIRNPAGNIIMLASFIEEEAREKLSEESNEFLDMIKTSAEQMLTLVNNLLDVSRIEAGSLNLKMESTDLGELIKNTVKLFTIQANAKIISISFINPETKVEVFADAGSINQILTNLISNALKYSHNNTRVTITLEDSLENARISVKDEGQGIHENDLNKLFKFFSRTAVQSTGGELSTGLGLAISRKLVEAHKGNISVESTPGKGSTFSFILPKN